MNKHSFMKHSTIKKQRKPKAWIFLFLRLKKHIKSFVEKEIFINKHLFTKHSTIKKQGNQKSSLFDFYDSIQKDLH